MFNSLKEIKDLNARMGFYFFDKGWMDLMHSSIESRVLYGRFFITRERNFNGSQYFFSIREALPDGRIKSIGGFQQFESKEDAIDYLDYHIQTVIVDEEVS